MNVQEHPLRDIARLLVYYGVPPLLRLLPAGTEFKLFQLMGRIYFLMARKKSRHLKSNFRKIFPLKDNEQMDDIVRGYIENHFVDRLQLFSFPRLNEENIHKYIQIDNMTMLRKSLNNGRGCVIIHGHFGPAQLFIAAIALAGFPITQLGYISREGYSYIGEKVALRKRLELESSIPGEIFYTDQFLRPIYKKLKNNEVISNAGDGSLIGENIGKLIPVSFLGEKRMYPIGSVSLAQHAGAVLLPLFISKVPEGRYIGKFGQPITVEPGVKGVEKAVQEFSTLLGNEIRKSPELWHLWDEFPDVEEPLDVISNHKPLN